MDGNRQNSPGSPPAKPARPKQPPPVAAPSAPNPFFMPTQQPRTRAIVLYRPLGITILCILQTAQIIPLLFATIFLLSFAPSERLAIALVLEALLNATWIGAASFGMWSGKKWGWWLGASFCLTAAFLNVLNFRYAADSPGRPPVLLTAVLTPMNILLVLYFFTDNVCSYFDRSEASKIRTAALLLVLSLLLGGLMLGNYLYFIG